MDLAEQVRTYEHEGQILLYILHFNGALSLLVGLVTVYVIVCHSSRQIGIYKNYLLNITCWAVALDLFMSVLHVPQIAFPESGLCSLGILSYFDGHVSQTVFLTVFIWIVGGAASAILAAFVYRYALLTNKLRLLHRRSSLFLLFLYHVLYAAPIVLAIIFATNGDYSEVMEDLKESRPDVYEFVKNRACVMLPSRRNPSGVFSIMFTILVMVILDIALYVFFIRQILGSIQSQKSKMSNRTQQMHRNLTNSLLVQLMIPVVTGAVPVTIIMTFNMLGYKLDSPVGRAAGHLLIIMASCHSIFSSTSMIFFVKPYRKACQQGLEFIFCLRQGQQHFVINRDQSTTTAVSLTSRTRTNGWVGN